MRENMHFLMYIPLTPYIINIFNYIKYFVSSLDMFLEKKCFKIHSGGKVMKKNSYS